MTSLNLLDATLNNASIPHQPYIIISDESTFGGVPLMREMIRRSVARHAPVLLVSVLRSPSTYLCTISGTGREDGVEIVDLTERMPGYGEAAGIEEIKAEIVQAASKLGPKVEIFIDAIDIFADDHTSSGALSIIRAIQKLIKTNKAPSQLTLLVSPQSSIYPSLIPPSFAASLTILQPHPLSLLSALSTAYLAPISAEPRFMDLLDMALERKLGERMTWLGESGIGDWSSGISGSGMGKGKGKSGDEDGVAAVQVTVRKSTGGAKGMSRSLEGLILGSSPSISISTGAGSSSSSISVLSVKPLEDIIDITPFSHPLTTSSTQQNPGATNITNTDSRPSGNQAAGSTHTSLNLPFNLSLTDEQRRRRDRVPIPYVHEGEGVEVGWEEEEDDDDDEEI